jgi:flagellar motor switch protein FliM
MAENQLTQAEIEALIGQTAPRGEVSSSDGDARVRSQQSTVEQKRRNRLWAIHEQAARDLGTELSAMLRAAVDVRLTGVDSVACQSCCRCSTECLAETSTRFFPLRRAR